MSLNLSLNIFKNNYDVESFLFFYRFKIKTLLSISSNKYTEKDIINIYVFIYRANKIYLKNTSVKELIPYEFVLEIFDILENLSLKNKNIYLKKAFFSTLLINYYIVNYDEKTIKNIENIDTNISAINIWFYIFNYIKKEDLKLILKDPFLSTLYNIFYLDFLFKQNEIKKIFPIIKKEMKNIEHIISPIISLNKKRKMIKKEINLESLLLNIINNIFLTKKRKIILNNINFPYIQKNLSLFIYTYINLIKPELKKIIDKKRTNANNTKIFFKYFTIAFFVLNKSQLNITKKNLLKEYFIIKKFFLQIMIDKNMFYDNFNELKKTINELNKVKSILQTF